MTSNTVNLTARIKRLEVAQGRAAKLPAKQVLSFKPMAELLGVSRPVLTGWADDIEGFEESGSFVRGGNGIEWAFKPKKTVDFLLRHFRKVAEGQNRKSREITKSVGVSLADDDEAVSLAEIKDRVNLTLSLTAAAEKQGQYVPAERLTHFLAGYNQAVVDGIMGVRTRVDPNGNLPPSLRKQIDEQLRSVASSVHALAVAFIEENGARTEQTGVGRAR